MNMANRRWLRPALITGLLLAAAGAGGWWWYQQQQTSAVSYRTARIERGALTASVSASGLVNPVTQVSVGTQVSGQIKELLVDFNSEVRAGQLIARIDPETFEYRVRQAQADVDAARASVLTAQANEVAALAQVSRARVDLQEAQRDLERKQSLVERQFIAQSEADRARALVNTTTEVLKSAQAQQGVAQAQVKSAQASVAQREAQLASAGVDLERTRITSPVNGIVIKRSVERGQTVAASLQSPELFVIAQNLRDMQVDASIDESDVGRIRTGLSASFTVDAFPGQTFEGTVAQVRKAAVNVANVVTYVAVVRFSNTADRLVPGMTANVRVMTDQRENVLKVPNAALRVRIAGIEPVNAAPAGAAPPAGGAAPASPAPGPAPSPAHSPASSPASSPATNPASNPPASGTSFRNGGGFGWPLAHAQGMGGGGGGGGGMAALRERLAGELQLSPEQLAKLDSIIAELRPRFMALRDLPDDQRAAAREKITADMRRQINSMLNPQQQSRYAQMQAQADAARTQAGGAGAPAAAAAAPPAAPPAAPAASAAASSIPMPAGGIAPPLPGGGPMVDTRNRLVAELRMNAAQAARLDAIYEAARPRFMALRDLPAEERPKARERISGEMRAQIQQILSAPQKERYAALVAESAGRQSTRGRIHLVGADGKPQAYNVRLGITDGSMTELLVNPNSAEAQVLKEGATVIIGLPGGAAAGGGGSGGSGARSGGPRLAF